MLYSYETAMDGLHGPPGFANEIIAAAADSLQLYGARLSAFLDDVNSVECPKISERWLTSLQWYGRATRESSAVTAIIWCGAALDIFGGSAGNVDRMARFAAGALKVPQSQVITAQGLTLRQAIEEVFGGGRSQLIHGGKPVLLFNYSELRALAETLTQAVLQRCGDRIAAYVESRRKTATLPDDFDAFLEVVMREAPSAKTPGAGQGKRSKKTR